jgi:hypothetical protein
MRHGEIYIYGKPPATERFDEIVRQLGQSGVSLHEPRSGKIFRYSRVGAPIVSTQKDIGRELVKSSWVLFRLYLGKCRVFCTIDKLEGGMVRENYDLSGNSEAESIKFIKGVVQRFGDAAEEQNVTALIVDRYAQAHIDFHWDDFVLGGVNARSEWPMFMGFSKSFSKLKCIPESYARVDRGEYMLFNSPDDGLENVT